ncbi:MAG: type II toxin-antitoxin system HicA family toxin [Firmicutes bacterium]|nr:type II toxin-antitoxin system HicA family toxin [Bacillota bacterium]
MKYSELKKKLRNAGCYIHKEGANHEQWFSPTSRKIFIVGRHNSEEVAPGTLHDILKKSGLK